MPRDAVPHVPGARPTRRGNPCRAWATRSARIGAVTLLAALSACTPDAIAPEPLPIPDAVAPAPRLPTRVRLGAPIERPSGDRWLGTQAFTIHDTPLGLLVDGGLHATLLRPDGRAERQSIPGQVVEVDAVGRAYVVDPHGNCVWDLRTRRADYRMGPGAMLPGDAPAGVSGWPSGAAPSGDAVWAAGDGRVVARQHGLARAGRIALPAPEMEVVFVVVGDDGRAWIGYRPRFRADLRRTPQVYPPDAAYVVVALELATAEEDPTRRFTLPLDVPYRPWSSGIQGAAWTPEGLLLLVGDAVGRFVDGTFVPESGLGTVRTLHRDEHGVVWAGGHRLQARRGGAWEIVLDALSWGAGREQFRYEAATGAVRRAERASGPGWTALPTHVEPLPALQHLHRGRGVGAAEAAILADGARVCGQPDHPAPFLTLFGDCDAWVGLTDLRAVLRGGPVGAEAMAPPVGAALSLDVTGERVYVGGTEAVAVYDGTRWERFPIQSPAQVIAAGPDATIWWAGAELCHFDPAVGTPRCVPLDPAGRHGWGIRELVAGPDHALLLTTYDDLLLARPGEPPRPAAEGTWRSILADPARGVVWALHPYPTSELVALGPDTGEPLGSWLLPKGLYGYRLGHDGAGALTLADWPAGRVLRVVLDP